MNKKEQSVLVISHLAAQRMVPIKEFQPAQLVESIQQHLADLEEKLQEYFESDLEACREPNSGYLPSHISISLGSQEG